MSRIPPTANDISGATIHSLKMAWKQDNEDLLIQKQLVDKLNSKLFDVLAINDLQTAIHQIGLLFSYNNSSPHILVQAVQNTLPDIYTDLIRLKCCIKSGESWFIIDSEGVVEKLRDNAFNNAVRSMTVNSIYNLKQLMSSSSQNNNTTNVYILPIYLNVCFWFIEEKENDELKYRRLSARHTVEDYAEEASKYLRDTFFIALEAASQYCMSAVIQLHENRKSNEMSMADNERHLEAVEVIESQSQEMNNIMETLGLLKVTTYDQSKCILISKFSEFCNEWSLRLLEETRRLCSETDVKTESSNVLVTEAMKFLQQMVADSLPAIFDVLAVELKLDVKNSSNNNNRNNDINNNKNNNINQNNSGKNNNSNSQNNNSHSPSTGRGVRGAMLGASPISPSYLSTSPTYKHSSGVYNISPVYKSQSLSPMWQENGSNDSYQEMGYTGDCFLSIISIYVPISSCGQKLKIKREEGDKRDYNEFNQALNGGEGGCEGSSWQCSLIITTSSRDTNLNLDISENLILPNQSSNMNNDVNNNINNNVNHGNNSTTTHKISNSSSSSGSSSSTVEMIVSYIIKILKLCGDCTFLSSQLATSRLFRSYTHVVSQRIQSAMLKAMPSQSTGPHVPLQTSLLSHSTTRILHIAATIPTIPTTIPLALTTINEFAHAVMLAFQFKNEYTETNFYAARVHWYECKEQEEEDGEWVTCNSNSYNNSRKNNSKHVNNQNNNQNNVNNINSPSKINNKNDNSSTDKFPAVLESSLLTHREQGVLLSKPSPSMFYPIFDLLFPPHTNSSRRSGRSNRSNSGSNNNSSSSNKRGMHISSQTNINIPDYSYEDVIHTIDNEDDERNAEEGKGNPPLDSLESAKYRLWISVGCDDMKVVLELRHLPYTTSSNSNNNTIKRQDRFNNFSQEEEEEVSFTIIGLSIKQHMHTHIQSRTQSYINPHTTINTSNAYNSSSISDTLLTTLFPDVLEKEKMRAIHLWRNIISKFVLQIIANKKIATMEIIAAKREREEQVSMTHLEALSKCNIILCSEFKESKGDKGDLSGVLRRITQQCVTVQGIIQSLVASNTISIPITSDSFPPSFPSSCFSHSFFSCSSIPPFNVSSVVSLLVWYEGSKSDTQMLFESNIPSSPTRSPSSFPFSPISSSCSLSPTSPTHSTLNSFGQTKGGELYVNIPFKWKDIKGQLTLSTATPTAIPTNTTNNHITTTSTGPPQHSVRYAPNIRDVTLSPQSPLIHTLQSPNPYNGSAMVNIMNHSINHDYQNDSSNNKDIIGILLQTLSKSIYDIHRGERKRKLLLAQREQIHKLKVEVEDKGLTAKVFEGYNKSAEANLKMAEEKIIEQEINIELMMRRLKDYETKEKIQYDIDQQVEKELQKRIIHEIDMEMKINDREREVADQVTALNVLHTNMSIEHKRAVEAEEKASIQLSHTEMMREKENNDAKGLVQLLRNNLSQAHKEIERESRKFFISSGFERNHSPSRNYVSIENGKSNNNVNSNYSRNSNDKSNNKETNVSNVLTSPFPSYSPFLSSVNRKGEGRRQSNEGGLSPLSMFSH